MKEEQEILLLIKQIREKKGISQRDMAKHLGIAQSSYNQIESGSTSLKFTTLLEITRFLDINFIPTQQKTNNKEETFIALSAKDIFDKLNLLEDSNKELHKKLDDIITLLNNDKLNSKDL